jgi:hypothetical protein
LCKIRKDVFVWQPLPKLPPTQPTKTFIKQIQRCSSFAFLLWLVVCVLHLRGKGGVFVGGALSAVVGDLEGKARLEARQHGDRQVVPAQTRKLKKKKKKNEEAEDSERSREALVVVVVSKKIAEARERQREAERERARPSPDKPADACVTTRCPASTVPTG